MYKLSPLFVFRSDGASIPLDPANRDYAEYLAWLAKGNIPTPADILNPNVAVMARISAIESATQVPRVVREFMMRVAEKDAVSTGVNLATDAPYQRVKAIDDQVRALRATLA